MEKSVVTHLLRTETKLNCKLNASGLGFEDTIMHMIKTQTDKGNTPCPCVADGSVFCPCKPWVQRTMPKKGKKREKIEPAKPGDKCHCELFVKV